MKSCNLCRAYLEWQNTVLNDLRSLRTEMHEMQTTIQDQEMKNQELQQQVAELQATRDETKRQVDEEIAELKRETAAQLEKTTNDTKSQLALIQATKQDEKLATKTPPISLRPERDPTTQLVISNVTYKEGEDLQSIVRQIASIKQADLPSGTINCFRVHKKTNKKNIPDIILKLKTQQTKKKLNTSQQGKSLCITDTTNMTVTSADYKTAQQHQQIYISENLTSDQSFIFWKTRIHKKQHNYKFAWTTDGISFLKEREDSKAHAIYSIQDLAKLAE